MAARVIGLGAGGHAKVMIEALLGRTDIEIVGLLDADSSRHWSEVLGVPILGGDELLGQYAEQGCRFFVGVGGARDASLRRALFEKARAVGLEPIGVIHTTAYVSPSAKLSAGVDILAGVVIGPGAVLRENVLVNTGAVIEHDATLEANVHVAVSATILGGATVEQGAFVGAGAVVREGVRIGAHAVIGAGAVVVRAVERGTVVVGVPAAPLDRAKDMQ